MPNILICWNFVSQHASYWLIFSPLSNIINREQHKKHLYNLSSHHKKKHWSSKCMPRLRISKSRCVLLTVYHYTTFPATLNTLSYKNSVRSASTSTTLTQVSHCSHYARIINPYLRSYCSGRSNTTVLYDRYFAVHGRLISTILPSTASM